MNVLGLRRGAPSGKAARRAGAGATTLAVAAALGAAVLVAGCSAEADTGSAVLEVLTAQVTQPNAQGVTVVYFEVQNNGPADEIIGAKSSAGGSVELRSPTHADSVQMRTVTGIRIPAHALFRLSPNGSHLLILHSGPMKSGTEITLTVMFAHGGSVSVPAMVTNPQTGGASYFLN
jgi:copper(I)-binding protein